MSERTLLDKVWANHFVRELDGQDQLFIGRHFGHEVTSPEAFNDIRKAGMRVRNTELTKFVLDHILPTTGKGRERPYKDPLAEKMAVSLEKNIDEFGIEYFDPDQGGICHVVFSEKGLAWPGTVIACGDSHTSTYGAFGSIAFGIGTSQVGHILGTQTMKVTKLKVRKIDYAGQLQRGVVAKDLILKTITELGASAGSGYAYEYNGEAMKYIGMEGRMTICNMTIEGGGKAGYVNPDEITYEFLKPTPFAPKQDWDKAVKYWNSIKSDPDAVYDDVYKLNASKVNPMVSFGTNSAQCVEIDGRVPMFDSYPEKDQEQMKEIYKFMNMKPGQRTEDMKVDKVFIGSCTNGRLKDLEEVAEVLKGHKVKLPTVVVPGSEEVRAKAEANGTMAILREAGAETRHSGCSMCLAMNPDKLGDYETCASTSNRNFVGRQGSKLGRTLLLSPYSAASAAIEGRIVHPGNYL